MSDIERCQIVTVVRYMDKIMMLKTHLVTKLWCRFISVSLATCKHGTVASQLWA